NKMTIINNEIKNAIDLIWNNKFKEAEEIFSSKSSSTPRYSLHNAETAFLKSFITANELETENALLKLKQTKELAEQSIRIFESNKVPQNYFPPNIKTKEDFKNHILDCKIVLGDSLYMLAVLQITRDHKFKGCFNLRKSWKIFEDTLRQVKDDEENGFQYSSDLTELLRFGCGFFYFAVSIIPQKYLKLVELVGFKADRDMGLMYLKDCLSKGGIRTPFATMVILFNNLLLPRGLYNPTHQLNEAQQLIEKNLEKYPYGSLFQVMGSHCYRKQCKIDMGLQCMEVAISNCNSLSKAPLIYKYELANCYCIKLQWDKAIQVFEELVKEEKFQIRALCSLQLGSCYIINGQKEKGIQSFNNIKNFCKKSSSVDIVINKQAQRYINNGGSFSVLEVLYLRRDMAKMEKSLANKTMDILNSIGKKLGVDKPIPQQTVQPISNNTTINNISLSTSSFLSRTFSNLTKKKEEIQQNDILIHDRAAYLLLKGAIYKSIDLYDQSMECFEELLSMSHLLTEKFYIPYSYYELSEGYYHKKNNAKALENILKCNKFTGYEWEDPLKVRLRVTLDQLKRDGAGISNDDYSDEDIISNNGNVNSDDLLLEEMNELEIEEKETQLRNKLANNSNYNNKQTPQNNSKQQIYYLENNQITSPHLINIPSPSIIQDRSCDNKNFIERVPSL
ncbi:hypothetical protein DICPUDRAFT_36750, partial [Dictyostelium purpureum]